MENSIFANMEEIWKDIPGYDGWYQVSNIGRVKSYKYGKEQILKPYDLKGYNRIALCVDDKRKHILVHRLVAETFIPNPLNLPCINHRNEIKTDNSVYNLEWCDHKYNNSYGTHGLKISNKLKGRKNSWLAKTVLQYTLDGQLVREWSSTRECGRNGFDQGAVSKCCRGEIKQYKGFIFKYKECI